MEYCFRYITSNDATLITLEQFVAGVPKLYACQFTPPEYIAQKELKKRKKKGKKDLETSKQEPDMIVSSDILASAGMSVGVMEFEKLLQETKQSKISKAANTVAEEE
jgi:hypothetical protein